MQLRSALPSYPLQCCKMPCQSIPSQSAAVLILQMKLNAECIQNFPNQYPHLFQWTLHWCSKWPKLIICSAVEAVAVWRWVVVGGPMRPEPDMSSGQGWSVDTDNAGCCSHLPPAIPSYCPLEIPPTPTKLVKICTEIASRQLSISGYYFCSMVCPCPTPLNLCWGWGSVQSKSLLECIVLFSHDSC